MHLGPMSPSLLPTPAALASCYLIPWPILLLLISRSVFHLLEHGVSSQELTQPTKGDIEQVTLSKQRRSSQKNPQEVLVRLSTATDDFCLSYAGVDATTAIEILKELDQQVEGRYRVTYNSVQRVLNLLFMLSYIHECIQVWLTDYKSDMLSGGILSRSDSCSLRFLGSPRVDNFSGVYASSLKEPDMCILYSLYLDYCIDQLDTLVLHWQLHEPLSYLGRY